MTDETLFNDPCCCNCGVSIERYIISRYGSGPFCEECWEIWRLWLNGKISFEKRERKLKYRVRKIKKAGILSLKPPVEQEAKQ